MSNVLFIVIITTVVSRRRFNFEFSKGDLMFFDNIEKSEHYLVIISKAFMKI